MIYDETQGQFIVDALGLIEKYVASQPNMTDKRKELLYSFIEQMAFDLYRKVENLCSMASKNELKTCPICESYFEAGTGGQAKKTYCSEKCRTKKNQRKYREKIGTVELCSFSLPYALNREGLTEL